MNYVKRKYYKLTAIADNGEVLNSMVFDTEPNAVSAYNDIINKYNNEHIAAYGDTVKFCENYYPKHPVIKYCELYPANHDVVYLKVTEVNFTKAFDGLPMVVYSKVTQDPYVFDMGYSDKAGHFYIGYTSERKETYFLALNEKGYDLLTLQNDMKKDKNWYS